MPRTIYYPKGPEKCSRYEDICKEVRFLVGAKIEVLDGEECVDVSRLSDQVKMRINSISAQKCMLPFCQLCPLPRLGLKSRTIEES